MKLPDRMLVLETEFKGLKKLIWALIVIVLANMGVQVI